MPNQIEVRSTGQINITKKIKPNLINTNVKHWNNKQFETLPRLSLSDTFFESLMKQPNTVPKMEFKNVNQSNATNGKKRKKMGSCPYYKVVENTTFAVDAFEYGDIEGVTHYFLTHFHADQYVGLKKSFCKPIIMSTLTGKSFII